MTALDPSPYLDAGPVRRAPKPHRPWRDIRLLLGVVLIVASIAGVWAVVALSQQTQPVLVAAHRILPGQTVGPADVKLADAALGESRDVYLTTTAAVGASSIATRTIGAGELVAKDAVAGAETATTTTVTVHTAQDVPSAVREGSDVDVWAAAAREGGGFDRPEVIVPHATVASVTRDKGVMGGSDAGVELVVPRDDVAAVLAAIANDAALSVVPNGSGR
ncbi:MAG TPA: SAF domain-containing protein [Microbacterium sp.]|uniref:SAF domain-containing protein n=1 Tax=Microbacterium sp. TaxID=51671 RepID=UPI002B461381|nr:SAF domain-containing protein [Microbacterium sp.]HKT57575.1 SAF domain-containing protein [Microbacterium sp.]